MVKMQGVLCGKLLEFRKLGIQEKHTMGDFFNFSQKRQTWNVFMEIPTYYTLSGVRFILKPCSLSFFS